MTKTKKGHSKIWADKHNSKKLIAKIFHSL